MKPAFAENPRVYCNWAKSHTDIATALELFGAPLHDAGAWKRAAGVWASGLAWPPFWNGDTQVAALALRQKAMTELLAGKLTDAAYDALPELLRTSDFVPFENAPEIVTWLVDHAGPNDAPLIADVVDWFAPAVTRPMSVEWFPLVAWLFERGTSELKSARRADLVARLLPAIVEHGKLEQVAAAIRVLLYNDRRIGSDASGVRTLESLLRPIEELLVGRPTATIIGDLTEACDPTALAHYVAAVLAPASRVPQSRAEILRRMARGELALEKATSAWQTAFDGPAEELELAEVALARAVATAFAQYIFRPYPRPDERAEDDRAWARVVARELLRLSDVLETRDSRDLELLKRCAAFGGHAARGVHEAVLAAIDASGDRKLDVARDMLAAPDVDAIVVCPVLESLEPKRVVASRAAQPNIAEMLAGVRELLCVTVPEICGFRFDEHVRDTREVVAQDLEGERAFVISDGHLRLPAASLAGMCDFITDPEEQRALGVLFALHELIHDFQGIADKQDVHTVRFAGAESALMHVDLGADHLASVLASEAFPKWDLLWLKDLQARSLEGFPPVTRSPRFSRIRKALRLVGLRTDRALRDPTIGTPHLTREAYGFADFSPSGGPFIAMVNRPPFVVIKAAEISSADADALFEAIERGGHGVAQVDDVVRRALRP